MALHANRHHRQQPGDGRSAETVALAERELALPDPVEPQAPKLTEVLHPNHGHLSISLRAFVHSALAPWRGDVPIQAPDVHQLRAMLYACREGHNGGFDNSTAWRAIFGSHAEAAQGRIRSIWQSVKEVRYPPPERYDVLVDAMASHIIKAFAAAAEQQRVRLEKRERERGPAPRAQACAVLLDTLPQFRAALEQYAKATGDTSYNGDLLSELDRLQRGLRRELS